MHDGKRVFSRSCQCAAQHPRAFTTKVRRFYGNARTVWTRSGGKSFRARLAHRTPKLSDDVLFFFVLFYVASPGQMAERTT